MSEDLTALYDRIADRFGDQVPAAAGAGPQTPLLNFLGRTV